MQLYTEQCVVILLAVFEAFNFINRYHFFSEMVFLTGCLVFSQKNGCRVRPFLTIYFNIIFRTDKIIY